MTDMKIKIFIFIYLIFHTTFSFADQAKVVVLADDDLTAEWEAKEQSSCDNNYIAEVHAGILVRLQEKLNYLNPRPYLLAYDYLFTSNVNNSVPNRNEEKKQLSVWEPSPPFPTIPTIIDIQHEFASLLSVSNVPIVLGGNPDKARYTTDNEIYKNRDKLFIGHCSTQIDIKKTYFLPLQQSGDIPEFGAQQSLAVISFAAYLQQIESIPKMEAISRAEKGARCISERFTVSPNKSIIWGLKLNKRDITTVSFADVINDTEKSKLLSNAIVIIGETRTGTKDIHDFFGDGISIPGVYSHAWLITDLIEKWDEIKESECFKSQ